MPACLAGAFVLIFGGYMKCLKASCFSLQAITSWSIFCTFSLSLCIYSNAKGDRVGRHSAPPASGNIIALVTWLPAVGGEAGSFPGRGEGGFPGPGLQQPRKRDSQKAHSVRSFPEWGARDRTRWALHKSGLQGALQTLSVPPGSCFPHSPVRLIGCMTGNACGLELSGDLHINLGRNFPDLPSPPKGKKFIYPSPVRNFNTYLPF